MRWGRRLAHPNSLVSAFAWMVPAARTPPCLCSEGFTGSLLTISKGYAFLVPYAPTMQRWEAIRLAQAASISSLDFVWQQEIV